MTEYDEARETARRYEAAAAISAAEHANKAIAMVACINCNARAGETCTAPNGNGRKAVNWIHAARWDEYRAAIAQAAIAAVTAPETVTAPKRSVSRSDWDSLAARREAAAAELAAEIKACRDEYGKAEDHTYRVAWVVTAEDNGYEVGSTVYIKARGISDVITMTRQLSDKGMLISSIHNLTYLGDDWE
jgi:hypothetical protein